MPSSTTSFFQLPKINPTFAKNAASEIRRGAIVGLVIGCHGSYLVSFFNESLATIISANFLRLCGIGAISFPLSYLSESLTTHFFLENEFMKQYPNLKTFIEKTNSLLFQLCATTVAAAMLGAPLGVTVISMTIIPTIVYVIEVISTAFKALLGENQISRTLDSLF